ncbi:MAG: 4Fe-4S ferredoxin [Candidatus Electrothrix sp. AUS1_2]|nr:4Fe-4S ferredoxin [Candidatus Electrothrix sp. AUS1_2]
MKTVAYRDLSKCTKDCLCLYVCPTGAADTENGKIDTDKCLNGCQQCVKACPSGAISLAEAPNEQVYPPQQHRENAVRRKMYQLAESKLRQERIAETLREESTDEREKTLLKGIALSNRLMAEDFMREGGYLLPQGDNVKALLSFLKDADFPESDGQGPGGAALKNLLRQTTHSLLRIL